MQCNHTQREPPSCEDAAHMLALVRVPKHLWPAFRPYVYDGRVAFELGDDAQ